MESYILTFSQSYICLRRVIFFLVEKLRKNGYGICKNERARVETGFSRRNGSSARLVSGNLPPCGKVKANIYKIFQQKSVVFTCQNTRFYGIIIRTEIGQGNILAKRVF